MTAITVAALQLALGSDDEAANIAAVSALVEEAAAKGAQLILPPELFSGPYFCREEDEALFALARPTLQHPSVIAMQALAAKLKVTIPTSFFERDGHHYYNTLAWIDPDGTIQGTPAADGGGQGEQQDHGEAEGQDQRADARKTGLGHSWDSCRDGPGEAGGLAS